MRYKTLKEIIELADELNPNSYSNNIKAQWVNEVETAIQTEVFVIAPVDVVSFLPYEDNKNKELSLDETWDKIYLTYLQAMIDFSNKEYAAFNNDIALYNSYVDSYSKWYVRHHGEGNKLISGMYLSAYGIAVKYGFSGTEEEWIASLKGEKGDTGHGLEIKGRVATYEELPGNAKIGDIWQVGLAGLLYLWDGKWEFLGSYKGEQGDKGIPGDKGDKGDKGDRGEQGIQGPQGVIGATGPKGDKGDTGAKGDKGDKGNPGADGVSIADIYSTADDTGRQTAVIITLTDGKQLMFEVPYGKDGKTPVKGVDYWTEGDKAEIKGYVDDEIGNYETAISEIIELQKQFINEITFSLNGTNYTCPKGMTWAELETYNDGAIWTAERLSIQDIYVYTGNVQLTTWNMNVPMSPATYPSDIIRDYSDNFSYSV